MTSAPSVITSRNNPLLVRIRKLVADSTAYRKHGELWLEGEHLCQAWAASGRPIAQSVISLSAMGRANMRALAHRAQSLVFVAPELMTGLSALESPPPIGYLVAWPGLGTIDPKAPTVVFDRLQDPGNVGTILRTAKAMGFKQAIALRETAALWSSKVVRAAMGAHMGLNLVEDAQSLDELDVPLLATSSHADRSLATLDIPWPCAWVFGSEGGGVREDLLAACRHQVRIPQPGGEESLNVAAAAAICLYETSRQQFSLH